MEVAVSKKDFVQAGKLDEVVAKLEKKIDMEKEAYAESNSGLETQLSVMTLAGGTKAFESRVDLEKEITDLTNRVSEAVAKKEFRKADELQKDVDAMKVLRQSLPSLLELEKELSTKKKDLERAISGKKFAEADDIHVAIECLEKKIAKECTLAPPPATGGASVRPMPVVPSTPLSVKSSRSLPVKPSGVTGMRPIEIKTMSNSKTVQSLRPKKAIIATASDSILSVVQLLTARRSDASILVDADGHLAGILTDTGEKGIAHGTTIAVLGTKISLIRNFFFLDRADVTRRVVAKDLDAASVSAAEVMTPNPTCVSLTDSGMDALTIMLENHFRHLPVTDESGSVVGLLDIAKCLNDAISKLELSQDKSSSAAEDAIKQVVGGGGAQNAALQALLGNLMAKAFGNKKMPTLRSVLAGKPSTVVNPNTSVRDVGQIMADHRKAALVVDNGNLVGIFGFKDMMTRVVAKCLPLDTTPVQDVMTEQPESVLPEVTVLEALQTMHDNKFLTLPVCEEDGRVVGVVGVMDVIYGCGGAEGWRSLLDSIDIDDDMSAVSAASNATGKHNAGSVPAQCPPTGGKGLGALDEGDERHVSKLRPNRPIISSWDDSVLSVSQLLRSKRGTQSGRVG
jgi:CBS domain-containing protein